MTGPQDLAAAGGDRLRAPAQLLFPRPCAPTRPAPTCGFTSHGRVGSTLPPERTGHPRWDGRPFLALRRDYAGVAGTGVGSPGAGRPSGVQAAPSALMISPMTGNQINIKR